jgi:hypothetical protein
MRVMEALNPEARDVGTTQIEITRTTAEADQRTANLLSAGALRRR